jgi:hypothetical protein
MAVVAVLAVPSAKMAFMGERIAGGGDRHESAGGECKHCDFLDRIHPIVPSGGLVKRRSPHPDAPFASE